MWPKKVITQILLSLYNFISTLGAASVADLSSWLQEISVGEREEFKSKNKSRPEKQTGEGGRHPHNDTLGIGGIPR